MRIASLVPSATEALFALGLGDEVVAVTHECDHPPAARELPRLTRSVIPAGLDAGEIDARVRELVSRGEALYELDDDALAELRPDLIVTQALCAVCAVSHDDVRAVAARLPSRPPVLSLDPQTLDEMLDDLVVLADAAGRRERGERLRAALRSRLAAVADRVRDAPRAAVVALEWLDPPYAGGHWVPEMIALAGGHDVLGATGARSRMVDWRQVCEASPEVVLVMPCGLYVDEAAAHARDHAVALRALGADRVIAVDAAASFSRPGPRLVDGVELVAHLLHPEHQPPPVEIAWEPLWESTAQSSR